MKKIIISIIVLILIIIATIFMFNFFKKSTPASDKGHFISSYQNYDWGFEFDYPLFKDWKVKSYGNEIRYTPSDTINIDFEKPPAITVSLPVKLDLAKDWQKSAFKNAQGIYYFESYDEKWAEAKATFYVNGWGIEILIPRQTAYKNFSGEQIWNTVINSFSLGK